MAVSVLQLVARLAPFNAMPDETVENVFHVGFNVATPVGTDVDQCLAAVVGFYTSTPVGGTDAVGEYIGESVSRVANACQVLAYLTDDLSGNTAFGSPIDSVTFTMPTALTGDPYPEEVAAVISYYGDLTDVPVSEPNPSPPPATIRPQQRRRGRTYVGPLQVAAGASGANQSRPKTAFRTDCTLSFKEMAVAIAGGTAGDLGIWSRADAEVWPAVAGWMDDAWDTQRRRGVAPTTRTTFTI